MIDGVTLTPLSIISNPLGDIYHGMKSSSPGFSGFGEAYFSTVKNKNIKGWKKHKQMIMNLIVVSGKTKFVIFDDRAGSKSENQLAEFTLSFPENYARLTVPPGVWMAFQDCSGEMSTILNIASIEHQPEEQINKPLSDIPYNWMK